MEVQKDFKEFLELLNSHKVEYLVVGGYALAFHGVPRFTGDIDIFVIADKENAERILRVLEEFGFGDLDINGDDFVQEGKVVQLGVAPVRIDIITSLSGLSWQEANLQKVDGKYGDVSVCFIGREEFIKNKRAIGRKRDIVDIEALGEK